MQITNTTYLLVRPVADWLSAIPNDFALNLRFARSCAEFLRGVRSILVTKHGVSKVTFPEFCFIMFLRLKEFNLMKPRCWKCAQSSSALLKGNSSPRLGYSVSQVRRLEEQWGSPLFLLHELRIFAVRRVYVLPAAIGVDCCRILCHALRGNSPYPSSSLRRIVWRVDFRV